MVEVDKFFLVFYSCERANRSSSVHENYLFMSCCATCITYICQLSVGN